MVEFLKTFGKGVLYFILFPIFLCFLILYGLYLLILIIFISFKDIIKFFKGKEIDNYKELDNKALNILKEKKIIKQNEKLENLANNTTINNTYNSINITPNDLNNLNNNLINNKDIPVIENKEVNNNDNNE